MLRIASLSLYPILTTNVHPYGCYVSKFVLKKKGKDFTICLQNLSHCNVKDLQRSPTLIWPKNLTLVGVKEI